MHGDTTWNSVHADAIHNLCKYISISKQCVLKRAEEISKTNVVFCDSAVGLLLTMLPNRHSQYPLKVTNSCSVAGHILPQSVLKQGGVWQMAVHGKCSLMQ